MLQEYTWASVIIFHEGVHPSIQGEDFGFEKLVYICTNMKHM